MATKPAHRGTPYMGPSDYGRFDVQEHLRAAQASARDLAAMARLVNSQPPDYESPERAYVSLRDVVGDLQLTSDEKTQAAAALKQMITDSRAAVGVAQQLKDIGIEQTMIPVLLKRGLKLAQEARNTGRNVFKSMPEGSGWESIPKGRKGGYRRHKAGGGYEYAYPDGNGGYGNHEDPHAGEHGDVHDEHDAAKPSDNVSAAYAKVAQRAKALGMSVDAKPHAGTSMADVKQLDALVSRHEAARKRKAGKDTPPAADAKPDLVSPSADDGGPSADDGPEEDESAPVDDNPSDDKTVAMVTEIMKLAEKKGIPADKVEDAIAFAGDDQTELATIRDYLNGMDDYEPAGGGADEDEPETQSPDSPSDTIPGLGHDVPESPHELARLREHVKALEHALSTMEQHLEKHEKAMHRRLRNDARRVRQSPSPQAVEWLNTRTRAFAILTLGAAAGLILGGPIGMLLGLTLADKHARLTAHQPGAIDAAAGAVSGAAGKVKAAVSDRKAKKEAEAAAKEAKRQEWLRQRIQGPKADAPVAKSLTGALRRRPSWGDTLLVEGRIVVLVPPPVKLLKARKPPEPVDDVLRKSEPMPPPPPPVADVPPPSNPWGLTPGQVLYVRKGDAWDIDPEVHVLPHGAFRWNEKRYTTGSALLKALTGRKRAGTTIARYFGLHDNRLQVMKSAAAGLQNRYAGLSFTAHGGAIRIRGDLFSAGFPGAQDGQQAMLLPYTDALTLLEDDNV